MLRWVSVLVRAAQNEVKQFSHQQGGRKPPGWRRRCALPRTPRRAHARARVRVAGGGSGGGGGKKQ